MNARCKKGACRTGTAIREQASFGINHNSTYTAAINHVDEVVTDLQ